jgi:tetratricopeptide (TPR) repeat protein
MKFACLCLTATLYAFGQSQPRGIGPDTTFQDLSARAAAAREANDALQAIDLYRQALRLNPQWQEGWWFLGTLLYDSDQYAAGRDAFERFVSLNADAGPGWAFLGLCEFETGEYTQSLRDVQHALSLGADKQGQLAPVLLYHEALLLTHERQFDTALQKYAAILNKRQAASVNHSMLLSVGLAALRVPKLPKDVAPSDTDLYLSAGRAASLVFARDYSRADAAFSQLLDKYPHTPNVHYMHGVYLMARDPGAAFQEFRRELEIASGNDAANAMLAWGLLSRGDSEEALPYAEKAAGAAKSTPFAKYLFGRALVETGAVQRGLKYLQEAEAADTNNGDVHVSLAAAYSRAGQPLQARRERDIAMQMESENRPVAQP